MNDASTQIECSLHGEAAIADGQPQQVTAHAEAALDAVAKAVAPVWPLADYVAVNPYLGMTDLSFLEARTRLRRFSDCESLMPLAYYRQRYQAGEFDRHDIDQAIDELVVDRVAGSERLDANILMRMLSESASQAEPSSHDEEPRSRFRSIASTHDDQHGTQWGDAIREEVGKHCAAYYDQGNASWGNPWKGLSLFAAWRSAMRHDRKLEILGLWGVRKMIASLPESPTEAIPALLTLAGVPRSLWQDYLLCLAFETPGWSAWTQHQISWKADGDEGDSALSSLIALRLAYDVALAKAFDTELKRPHPTVSEQETDSDLQRFALLKANEIGYRRHLLGSIHAASIEGREIAGGPVERQLAQMAFCIDVRSERIRRQLEATGEPIETLGFAGFFGLPFEFECLGESGSSNQLPVLVAPQFKVKQTLRSHGSEASDGSDPAEATALRNAIRLSRKKWKGFQTSAVSAFAFVESVGPLFGLKLLSKLFGRSLAEADPAADGITKEQRPYAAPSLASLVEAGVTPERQAEMAHSILKGMGLTSRFARLVVFCGHGSQTTNNPLQAGLDCGACGGHSGEPNARLAALMLNQPHVRQALAERGIEIPADTHFLGGLHNTTTDELEFFEVDLVPESHRDDLERLKKSAGQASHQNRLERSPTLGGTKENIPQQRSSDWSEVRPEWGLTGNAAFVVGPRRLTSALNLAGRSFLHNYDHRQDPEGAVLEAIMTAPMVVTNWINLQYFASTTDQRHFGSGRKTIHNVVGRFGVFSGNGGDLTTGLPWESLHDGQRYQHDPVRLLTVIAAPRESIAAVLAKHEGVANLVVNGWLNLVALDEGQFYRFTSGNAWEAIDADEASRLASGSKRSEAMPRRAKQAVTTPGGADHL